MNPIIAILIIFISGILSVTFGPILTIRGAEPELIVITLILISLAENNFTKVMAYSLIAAIILGFLGNLPFLISALSLFVSIGIANLLFRYFSGEFSFYASAVYIIISYTLFKLLEIVSLFAYNHFQPLNGIPISFLAIAILGQVVYNIILAISIFIPLKKFYSYF